MIVLELTSDRAGHSGIAEHLKVERKKRKFGKNKICFVCVHYVAGIVMGNIPVSVYLLLPTKLCEIVQSPS